MKRCPTCDHVVESERAELQRNVFVFTVMTIVIGWVTFEKAEWTMTYVAARWPILLMFAGIPAAAVYFWVRLLRLKKGEHHDA